MKAYIDGRPDKDDPPEFEAPGNIVFLAVDEATGAVLPANSRRRPRSVHRRHAARRSRTVSGPATLRGMPSQAPSLGASPSEPPDRRRSRCDGSPRAFRPRAKKSAPIVARELHDELGQTLTAIKLELGRTADALKEHIISTPPVIDRLQSLVGLVEIGVAMVKRIATKLRPPALDHLGLAEAIRWEAVTFSARSGLRCHVARRQGTDDADAPSSRRRCSGSFRRR